MKKKVPFVYDILFELGCPHAGWLPFTLTLGEFSLTDDASGVLNDPAAEIVEAERFLAEHRRGRHRICFWGEPGGDAVDLEHAAGDEVRLTVQSAANFHPPMADRPMRLDFECLVNRPQLLRTVTDARKQWVRLYADSIREHWCEDMNIYRPHSPKGD